MNLPTSNQPIASEHLIGDIVGAALRIPQILSFPRFSTHSASTLGRCSTFEVGMSIANLAASLLKQGFSCIDDTLHQKQMPDFSSWLIYPDRCR